MERRITATEARIHFGEVMRRVMEQGEQVVVEKDGQPQVVIVSVADFERIKMERHQEGWEKQFEEMIAFAARVKVRRGGQPLTPPEDIIREAREERDAQLTGMS